MSSTDTTMNAGNELSLTIYEYLWESWQRDNARSGRMNDLVQ